MNFLTKISFTSLFFLSLDPRYCARDKEWEQLVGERSRGEECGVRDESGRMEDSSLVTVRPLVRQHQLSRNNIERNLYLLLWNISIFLPNRALKDCKRGNKCVFWG